MVASVHVAAAQARDIATPQPAQPVFSMGQPPTFRPYFSALALGGLDGGGATAMLGVAHPILNPVTGLLGATAEAYGQWRRLDGSAGLRALATIPAAGFGVGADWRVTQSRVDPLFTFQTALRRGGLLGHGSMLRVDWIPARHQEFGIGLSLPFDQPFAGRTRPRATSVRVAEGGQPMPAVGTSAALPDAAERALRTIARDASLIAAFTNLYTPADQERLASAGEARDYDEALRSYDKALAAAFVSATTDTELAASVATHARAVVLDRTLIPYDALFGQVKNEHALSALIAESRTTFARWLSDSSLIATGARPIALAVFDRWAGTIAAVERELLAHWRDSRLVWLPAQLALAPGRLEQSDVDDIVGRVAGHRFADNNELAYLQTADMTLEIARSIVAARRYHVLWTHDFTGRRPSGRLDEISYTLVADAYLPALTAAVQRYDSTGDMPQFFFLLDAFYYHARWGRLWMSVLESPLTAGVPLRSDEADQADHLRRRLDALRDAVASSRRLQREAAINGGSAWLAKVVKVNVNVVLPSDFSFRSSHILPPFPFVSDNVMRDHRKLVLYDYTEAKPYDGDLLVTGVGIGEHYASATWEDRGYRVRGPAALEARAAVRRALASNGFAPDQIPVVLRVSDPRLADSTHAAARSGIGRALQVDNEPGFGTKRASAARAMLYTLAPPGSDIIVPDPLWLSESWAVMLLAAAARGCRVAIIAPAAPNSPNPERVVVAQQHDMLHRMLTMRDRLAPRIRAAGGAFYIGIYAGHAPVTDPRGRFAEVRAGLARAPWIREMIPFDSSALTSLDDATMQAERAETGATLAKDEQPREPQLHQKTQLIAGPGTIAALVRQPGWARILSRALLAQSRETAHLADAVTRAADTSVVGARDELLEGYERSLSASDRKRLSLYFTVGTENHDTRGLLMDGEASVIVSGFDASVGVVDLFYLMARTTWANDGDDIDRLVPARKGLIASIARLIRFAL